MTINQKSTGRAMSIPAGLAFGAGISLGITLFMAAIIAYLLETEKITWEGAGYGIMALLLIASSLGSMMAYSMIKRQRLLVCLLSGVVYLGILLSMTALFFGGQYDAVGVTMALIIAGSGTSGLLGMREKGRGKREKSRVRYR